MAAIGSVGVSSRAMATYVLVSCGKEKLDRPAPAKDLYTSQLFKKSRAWAERSGHPWFILSAKHGLVHPDTVLEPYDVSVESLPMDRLYHWGSTVADKLMEFISYNDTLIVLAGGKYLDFARWLAIKARKNSNADVKIVEPMKGMQIGQRLSWLKQQLEAPAPAPAARLCPIRWGSR